MPIGNIPVPPEGIDEEPTVSICINKTWAHTLIGQIWDLRYPEAWGGTLEENRRARGEIKNLITMLMGDEGCDDMKNCCVEVAITIRINQTTGNIEQSADNGATWQPVAGGLQSVIVQPVPPVTSGVSATKCDAATNVSTQVDAWIDQVSNDFDTATSLLEFGLAVIAAMLGAVLVVVTGGGFLPAEALLLSAMGAAFYAAWNAGKAVFDAYWTTDKKDAILCAAYCNISDDGSFTDAQFSAFWHDVNQDLPASPAKMLFMGFLSSVGMAGLNAMAASGLEADADCADCDCFEDCASTWDIFGDDPTHFHGTIDERGEGYIIASSGSGGYLLIRTPDADSCCLVTSLETISGTDSYTVGWTDCGTTPVEGAPQHTGLFDFDSYCVNYFQLQALGTFTVKLTFEDCP